MHDIHTISLHALLGQRPFTAMLKNVFKQEVSGGRVNLSAVHERIKGRDRENYQNNEDE
jgi:hypothetical protein